MKIICTLENASANISGVAFFEHAHGMISEELEPAAANAFIGIPGYYVEGQEPEDVEPVKEPEVPAPAPTPAPTPAPAAKAAKGGAKKADAPAPTPAPTPEPTPAPTKAPAEPPAPGNDIF